MRERFGFCIKKLLVSTKVSQCFTFEMKRMCSIEPTLDLLHRKSGH